MELTSPFDARIDLPPDAYADLDEGFLLSWSNYDEGWAVILLRLHGAYREDEILALQFGLEGVQTLRLDDDEMARLEGGETVAFYRHPGRYLVRVSGVYHRDGEHDNED